jgi:histidinol-phosphate aminotransferase
VSELPLRPRRVFEGLKAAAHGGVLQLKDTELKALGVEPGEILDFSVCTNPFMPPPGIKTMLNTIRIDPYPDPQSTELVQALSKRLGITPENILAGSGTTELIRLIAMVYIRQGEPVVTLEPTYGEYEVASRLSGANIIKYRARESDDFTPDTGEFAGLVRKHKPRAVFICNPGNPSGRYLPRRDIEAVLENLGDGLLVLDEAYVAFTGESWNSLELTGRGNIIVLRSMTKDYGLPGLRLGYAVARREIIDCLRPALPPWNVNSIAQKVGTAVLEQEEYLRQSLKQVREAGRFLAGEIARLGFTVVPSDTHYFLVKAGNAPECRRALLKKGVLVRDGSSFGLGEYIRVSPRTMPDCIRLVEAFKDITKNGTKAFTR